MGNIKYNRRNYQNSIGGKSLTPGQAEVIKNGLTALGLVEVTPEGSRGSFRGEKALDLNTAPSVITIVAEQTLQAIQASLPMYEVVYRVHKTARSKDIRIIFSIDVKYK